jgi:hypothetical protein
MTGQLGEDLHALAIRQGSALTSVVALTTLPSRAVRGQNAFRLEYADGRVLKGRSFKNPAEAAECVELSRHLDVGTFPPTIAHAGTGVLSVWIEGRPLAVADCGAALVERCGRLLALIHTTRLDPADCQRAAAAVARDLPSLGREIDELVARGVLDARQAARAAGIAAEYEPAERATGLVHDDFCAENMVVDGEGRLWVVDNENVGLGALDFDLARTWYRWPLAPALRAAFYRGYAEHRPLDSFRAHFWFWAISALVGSAAFRLRVHDDGIAVPCRRLDDLLQTSRTAEPLAL